MATKSAQAIDLTTTCWTCSSLQEYVDLTQSFADKLSTALQDPMLILFTSLCGLWIVVTAVKILLNLTNRSEIIKDFVFISITGILLGSQATSLISYVYSSALSIMGSASKVAFTVAGGSDIATSYTGMVALAATGEKAIAKVFQAAGAIAREGGVTEPQYYLYALILVLPYLLLIISYASQIVVAIFRAMMVGIFAPFLFMAFAFGWGRGMAYSGAKTLLSSIMVLFASTAALALTIYGVKSALLDLEPNSLTGNKLTEFASITNPEFLVIMFLGWAGTAFQTEGTSLANSIAGTMLSNTAAGIMTAGAVATAGTAAALGMKPINAAANAAGGWGKLATLPVRGATAGAKALVDKFRNINKPGAQ